MKTESGLFRPMLCIKGFKAVLKAKGGQTQYGVYYNIKLYI